MSYEWWSDPLTDRTQTDIDYRTPKASLNASDLNRIEGNIGVLARDFDISLITQHWQRENFLRVANIKRILENTSKIKKVFKIQSDNYDTLLYWNDLNIIETILLQARNRYLSLIDWDCLECQFDTWDDFENGVISWNYLEDQLGCQNTKTWDWFESEFIHWYDMENKIENWDYFNCPNKGGA